MRWSYDLCHSGDKLGCAFTHFVLGGLFELLGIYPNWCMFGLKGWEKDFVDIGLENVEMRRMARAKAGRLALLPAASCLGDTAAVCKGGSVPLIFRGHGRGFELIGESYVYGVMKGEAFTEGDCKTIHVI